MKLTNEISNSVDNKFSPKNFFEQRQVNARSHFLGPEDLVDFLTDPLRLQTEFPNPTSGYFFFVGKLTPHMALHPACTDM